MGRRGLGAAFGQPPLSRRIAPSSRGASGARCQGARTHRGEGPTREGRRQPPAPARGGRCRGTLPRSRPRGAPPRCEAEGGSDGAQKRGRPSPASSHRTRYPALARGRGATGDRPRVGRGCGASTARPGAGHPRCGTGAGGSEAGRTGLPAMRGGREHRSTRASRSPGRSGAIPGSARRSPRRSAGRPRSEPCEPLSRTFRSDTGLGSSLASTKRGPTSIRTGSPTSS